MAAQVPHYSLVTVSAVLSIAPMAAGSSMANRNQCGLCVLVAKDVRPKPSPVPFPGISISICQTAGSIWIRTIATTYQRGMFRDSMIVSNWKVSARRSIDLNVFKHAQAKGLSHPVLILK